MNIQQMELARVVGLCFKQMNRLMPRNGPVYRFNEVQQEFVEQLIELFKDNQPDFACNSFKCIIEVMTLDGEYISDKQPDYISSKWDDKAYNKGHE